ncbi:MAG TPA: fumarate hydratase [Clostridia bacterium]|nr:fumarate hydratase [Clostridia bacterium]
MKIISYQDIVDDVARLCIDINYVLDRDVLKGFQESLKVESSPVGKEVLELLIKNAQIAEQEQVPMCQDTGAAVVFIELGEDVRITGGTLTKAITEGVRKGYQEGYLRKSMCDPFTRENTKDNTPSLIHTEIVPGDKLVIHVAAKGGGSENMSSLKMLSPSEGMAGLKKFVVDTVKAAGPNPCPPLVVGVGVGGNFETCAMLAKKALLRKLGDPSKNEMAAKLEKELLAEINNTGIGPAGFGGSTTALAIHIEVMPCHIATFPVAINLNCHASRHGTVEY